MIREIDSLKKQLQESKSESRYLKEGVLPDLYGKNKRLVEENKRLSAQLDALKGRPFEDGKDSSRNTLAEQARMIPHTVQSNAVYLGLRRKLVMALDVGTTFSCVSYRYVRTYPNAV
jgi:cell division protein FtsB